MSIKNIPPDYFLKNNLYQIKQHLECLKQALREISETMGESDSSKDTHFENWEEEWNPFITTQSLEGWISVLLEEFGLKLIENFGEDCRIPDDCVPT